MVDKTGEDSGVSIDGFATSLRGLVMRLMVVGYNQSLVPSTVVEGYWCYWRKQ